MKKIILIVEDEPSIAENIFYTLEKEGFTPIWSPTAQAARFEIKKQLPDLILLDVGLPDVNGFEFCKEILTDHKIPIIFLTARSEEIDRVVGLEIGAEDYLVKPFSLRELLARIRIVLRRPQSFETSSNTIKESSNKSFKVIEERCEILFLNQRLNLSRYEYCLLKVFIQRPGRVYSRDQLMELAWENAETSLDRTVDAHIKNIRKELKKIDPEHEWIETHRGFGYALKES